MIIWFWFFEIFELKMSEVRVLTSILHFQIHYNGQLHFAQAG